MLVDMILQVQPYIEGIPQGKSSAWRAATHNDGVTVKTWAKQWVDQTKINIENYDMIANSVMTEFQRFRGQPVILMGSGPSLEKNWTSLIGDSLNHFGRGKIPIITNVHNFPFCEDRNIMKESDYYLILDAGDICIKEMYEGGKHDEAWYWERTKNRTLIAYHGTHPEFLKRWQGPIKFYSTPSATMELSKEFQTIIDSTKIPGFNVGGNVMGAALYFARAILGCSVPIFMGMDLCFSYNRKFHPWDCWYNEKFSGVIPWTDIFGNRVYTWNSYFGFKNWFDYIAVGGNGNNPHLIINATEGGILGSYPEGNIKQIIQLDLATALHLFNMSDRLPDQLKQSAEQMHLLF